MKKLLFTLASFCILWSCSNNSKEQNTPDNQLYDVNFNVETTVSVNDLKNTSSEIPDYIQAIFYYLYNSNGELIKKENYNSEEYSNISDQLPAGDYSALFVAQEIYYQYAEASNERIDDIDFFWRTSSFDGQQFLQKIDFSVSEDATTVPVELERITGKVTLMSKDLIPASYHKLVLEISNVQTHYYIHNKTYPLNSDSKETIEFDLTEKADQNLNESVHLFAYDSGRELSFWLKFFDADGNLIKDQTFENIPIIVNKETIISSSMFSSNSTSDNSFKISILDQWNTPINIDWDNDNGIDYIAPYISINHPYKSGEKHHISCDMEDRGNINTSSFVIKDSNQNIVFDSKTHNDADGNPIVVDQGTNVDADYDIILNTPADVYTVEWTATDDAGNTSTESIDFLVS